MIWDKVSLCQKLLVSIIAQGNQASVGSPNGGFALLDSNIPVWNILLKGHDLPKQGYSNLFWSTKRYTLKTFMISKLFFSAGGQWLVP